MVLFIFLANKKGVRPMAEEIKVPAGVYDMVTRCMEQELSLIHI